MTVETKVELARRICSEAEVARAAEGLSLPEHELVSLAFSAKESLYKCLYPVVGRFMDLHAATVSDASVTWSDGARVSGELTLELARDWSAEFRTGRRFQALFHKGGEHVETAVLLSA